jgi:DNA polymerase-3 subunit epsilon
LYCQKELEDAHDALADVRATVAVFEGQIRAYEGKDLLDEEGNIIPAPIKNDMQAIHEFTNDLHFVDATQKLRVQADGTVVFNFGKYVGESVKTVLARERHYAGWIIEKEFSSQVKQYIKQVVKELEGK